MKPLSIILIEDDPYFSHRVYKILKDFGAVDLANFEDQAKALIEKNHYDLAVIDLNLEDNASLGGLKVLKLAKSKGIYSIILSNNDEYQTTKKAYEGGCDHFLAKRHFQSSLKTYVEKFLKSQSKEYWSDYFKDKFITQDEILIRNIRNLTSMDLRNQSIFLGGETGVGKTFLAKLIHQMNYNNDHFVHFNCSELPKDLIESELFGYEKGAFTGANQRKVGLIEKTHNGTLFLDEIATMPLYTQQKLLKVLDEKQFYSLGSSVPKKVDFTLISATCEDLKPLIKEKKFREDFYYRISGFELIIPPLRERIKDIRLQIFHFLSKSERKFFLEEDVFKLLMSYAWPGNTRELMKLIQKFSRSQKGIIEKHHSAIEKLENSPMKLSHSSFLTETQKEILDSKGLKELIRAVEMASFRASHLTHDAKATKIIKDLQISNSHFYRLKAEFDKENSPI